MNSWHLTALLLIPLLGAFGSGNEAATQLELVDTSHFVGRGLPLKSSDHAWHLDGQQHHCKETGPRMHEEEDFAIVPISSMYYLASRADLAPVACVSNLVLYNHTTNTSASIPIVKICTECPSNYFYLPSSTIQRLGWEQTPLVQWSIDKAKHFNLTEMWPKRNISREILGKAIASGVQKSVLKNSMRGGDHCSLNASEVRSLYMSGNFSHMFQRNPDLMEGLELQYKLERIEHIPESLCNSYQGLTCKTRGPEARCECLDTGKSNSTLAAADTELTCIYERDERDHFCLSNLEHSTERAYGVQVPPVTNECWFFRTCQLVQNGDRCIQAYQEALRTPTRKAMTSTIHLFRFRLVDDPDSPECLCADSRTHLNAVTTAGFIHLTLMILSLRNILGVGAECDPRLEELRQNHSGQLRTLDGRLNSAMFQEGVYKNLFEDLLARSQVAKTLKVLVDTQGAFCKTYNHLMCNASGICGCYAKSSEDVVFVRENEACVLESGSICDPEYWNGRLEIYVNAYEEDGPPPTCQHEDLCVDPTTGKLCPRDGNLPRISFKDKVFPYLSPHLAIENWDEVREEDYCRCGQLFEIENPILVRLQNVAFVIVPLIVVLAAAVGSVWARNRRKLRKLTEDYLSNVLPNDLSRFSAGCEVDSTIMDEAIKALCARYRKEEFEIPAESINIGLEIGSGAFGIVRKGTLVVDPADTENAVEVAIKNCTFNNVVSIMDSVRALLAEIKLLQYIQEDGTHPHVVAMLHAVTVPESGAPLLILEYCDKGNLEKILKSIDRQKFFSQINTQGKVDLLMMPGYPPRDDGNGGVATIVCTKQLLLWTHQLSSGMAFLHDEKRLIHGDLFTKNVLVDAQNVAKVCDFGIAKRLKALDKDYARVTAKEVRPNDPKFWPPETCSDNSKLTPSLDIWTFGAIVWEIFSLGEPAESHCKTRVTELQKPRYASQEIDSIMRECWIEDPGHRITLSGDEGIWQKIKRILGIPAEC